MAIIPFLTAVLATYRLAHLLTEDNGPFFIFDRIRIFVSAKKTNEASFYGFWSSIEDFVFCPYCQGIYIAILISLLIVWNNFYGNLFILAFAIAGGQSILQEWIKK